MPAVGRARRVARPSIARVIPFGSGATIKRQKVPTRRRSFRSPPLSSTLLQQSARIIEPQKRSAETRARSPSRRFCAARTMACAAQLQPDVLTVFPNTLLRFYGETAGLSHGIRLTCDICSTSETSRRERRDCAFLPDARRVEDIGPYSRRTLDAEHVCPNPYLTIAVERSPRAR